MKTSILIAVLALASAVVYAEEDDIKDVELGQGMQLHTTVGGEIRYDSNLYLAEDNESSAVAYVLQPGVNLIHSGSRSRLYLRYRGELAEYDISSVDDYFDNSINAGFTLDASSRHRFAAEVTRFDYHDPFGLDRTENVAVTANRDLDEYDLDVARGEYTFGARGAKFNLGVYGEYRRKEYDSNRSQTRFLDRTLNTVGFKGVYNLSKRTMLLLDLETSEVEYDEVRTSFTARDATVERALIGVRWFATAKTVGAIQVGHVSRDHDDRNRSDFSDVDWKVSIGWSPTARATLTLETARTIRESFLDEANFINTESVGLTWDHQWRPRFSTEAGYAYFTADFDGALREDEVQRFEVVGVYKLNKRTDLRAGYEFQDRDSNDDTVDFDRNIWTVAIRARY